MKNKKLKKTLALTLAFGTMLSLVFAVSYNKDPQIYNVEQPQDDFITQPEQPSTYAAFTSWDAFYTLYGVPNNTRFMISKEVAIDDSTWLVNSNASGTGTTWTNGCTTETTNNVYFGMAVYDYAAANLSLASLIGQPGYVVMDDSGTTTAKYLGLATVNNSGTVKKVRTSTDTSKTTKQFGMGDGHYYAEMAYDTTTKAFTMLDTSDSTVEKVGATTFGAGSSVVNCTSYYAETTTATTYTSVFYPVFFDEVKDLTYTGYSNGTANFSYKYDDMTNASTGSVGVDTTNNELKVQYRVYPTAGSPTSWVNMTVQPTGTKDEIMYFSIPNLTANTNYTVDIRLSNWFWDSAETSVDFTTNTTPTTSSFGAITANDFYSWYGVPTGTRFYLANESSIDDSTKIMNSNPTNTTNNAGCSTVSGDTSYTFNASFFDYQKADQSVYNLNDQSGLIVEGTGSTLQISTLNTAGVKSYMKKGTASTGGGSNPYWTTTATNYLYAINANTTTGALAVDFTSSNDDSMSYLKAGTEDSGTNVGNCVETQGGFAAKSNLNSEIPSSGTGIYPLFIDQVSDLALVDTNQDEATFSYTYTNMDTQYTEGVGTDDGLTFQYRLNDGAWVNATTQPTGLTDGTNYFTITGLSEDTTYDIDIRLSNYYFETANETTMDFNTEGFYVDAPTMDYDSLTATFPVTIGGVYDMASATLEYSINDSGWVTYDGTLVDGLNYVTIDGFQPNTAYTVEFRLNGYQDATDTVTFTTDDNLGVFTPGTLTVGTNTATIPYTITDGDGQEIIEWSIDDGNTWTQESAINGNVVTNDGNIEITGLNHSTTYEVLIKVDGVIINSASPITFTTLTP